MTLMFILGDSLHLFIKKNKLCKYSEKEALITVKLLEFIEEEVSRGGEKRREEGRERERWGGGVGGEGVGGEGREKGKSPGLVGKEGLISIPVLSLFSKVTLGELFNLYKPNFLIDRIEIIKEPTL